MGCNSSTPLEKLNNNNNILDKNANTNRRDDVSSSVSPDPSTIVETRTMERNKGTNDRTTNKGTNDRTNHEGENANGATSVGRNFDKNKKRAASEMRKVSLQ